MTGDLRVEKVLTEEQIDAIYDALPKHPEWDQICAGEPYYSRVAIRLIGNVALSILDNETKATRSDPVEAFIALVDAPCETKGPEDAEPGCCEPCRARALLATRSDEALREVVTKCRDKFAEYVELHRAKMPLNTAGYEDIQAKVWRNQEMVDLCNEALNPPGAE